MNSKLVITALLIMLLFAVAGFAQDEGGPDTYGYIWKTSNAEGGPVYTWIEPDTTHDAPAEYTEFDDDGNTPLLEMNMSFPFYDNVYTQICLGSNGIVGFTTESMSTLSNQQIPNTSTPNNLIAWFWDDLNPLYTWAGSHCYYQNATYNDMNAFVVSYVDYAEYGSTGTYPANCLQAQIILVENGDIFINYDWLGASLDLTSCTIGTENADGTDGLLYVYNDTAGANITDDMSLAFYRPIAGDNDLRATLIDGPLETAVGVLTSYTITVFNNGTVAQDTYDVKLMADDDIELATVAGTEIQPGATIDYILDWTPDAGGTYFLYGQTFLTDDINPDNDHCQSIEVFVNPEHDLTATAIAGNVTPSVGESTTYTISVMNQGGTSEDTYTVYLKDTNGNVLGEQAGTTLAFGETADFAINWTPESEGPLTIFGEVTLTGDEIPGNNTTVEMNISVQPEGTTVLSFGNDTTTSNTIPIDFFYRNSLSQTIFYPEELQLENGGDLTAITFYNHFPETVNLTDQPITIWVGETELQDLSGGYIPSTELTQVFNGTLNFPAGENAILIPLDEWYFYNGGNLVIFTYRPYDSVYYDSNSHFFYSTTADYPNRTRSSWDDTTQFDPAAPPTDDFTLYDRIPNISLFFANTANTGVTGYVYNEQTSPLADATVTMTPGDVEYTTDVDGYFEFLDIEPGTYSFTAEVPGYLPDTISDVVVEDGETANITFYLEQVLTVTINVTTNAGSAEGAQLIFENGTDTFEETVPASGTVNFYDIPTGTYSLDITLDGYANYFQDNIAITGTTELNVELTELTNPPQNPECNYEAYFTWEAPEVPVNLTRNGYSRKQVIDNLTRNNKSYREETASRPLQHYKVYLDGSLVTTTDDLDYQFDTEDMSIGQTYTAGVSAQYLSGESTIVTVNFIYGQEELYPPINVECDSLGHLTWQSGQPASLLRKNTSSKDVQPMDRDFIQYRVYLDGEYVNWTLNLQYQYTGLEVNTTYTAGVSAFYTSGNSTIVEVEFVYMPQSAEDTDVVPVTTSIMGNYPNPFNPETTIEFAVSKPGQTNLTIYNVKGQKVRTLIDQYMEAQVHNVVWNGQDNSGKKVTSGVYYAVLKAAGSTPGVKKMILLK